jgi:hypothetical protein
MTTRDQSHPGSTSTGLVTGRSSGNAPAEDECLATLERDGIVRLPRLLTQIQLRRMQDAFKVKLRRMKWNNVDGYEKTEPYRHMIEDVLTLDQGFVDVALHPLVMAVMRRYLGETFQLVEAKGWKSIPTTRDFHGWHADAWYDQTVPQGIPREVKLALYLTDVNTGAFNYVVGSHRQQPPRLYRAAEVGKIDRDRIVEMAGPAGSAFLFDTTGIHRQGVPMLEPRQAIFFDYHDPSVPLQKEDRDYHRYHPLLLNAAFLGGLSEEDSRVLGFGDSRNYVPAFERRSPHHRFEALMQIAFDATLHASMLGSRIAARLRLMRRG